MLDENAQKLKNELSALMFSQTLLLDFLIHQLVEASDLNEEQAYIAETIKIMLQSIGISIHSILRLTETIDMAIKDCFGIARTVSEMSINVAYIAASDVEIAQRAQSHALQKIYRDFHRISESGELRMEVRASNIRSPEEIVGLPEALKMFTNKKGKEIRAWSPKSLDQKITTVGVFNKNAHLNLFVSKSAIYRHSSELLHGSYFGVRYFWTSPDGAKLDRAEIENNWVQSHFVAIFNAVFFGTAGVIETCTQKFNLPEIKQYLDELFDKANEIIFALEEVT